MSALHLVGSNESATMWWVANIAALHPVGSNESATMWWGVVMGSWVTTSTLTGFSLCILGFVPSIPSLPSQGTRGKGRAFNKFFASSMGCPGPGAQVRTVQQGKRQERLTGT